jgi:isoleucyl-tRNA synthetase
MAECLERLLLLASPILSFTAEEGWQHGPKAWGRGESVFLADLPALEPDWRDAKLAERWGGVLKVRETVQKSLEEARAAKKIGSSLQAKVAVKGFAAVDSVNWPEVLLVSQAELLGGSGELSVAVSQAPGSKCPRCWRWQTDIGAEKGHPEVCGRCARHLS